MALIPIHSPKPSFTRLGFEQSVAATTMAAFPLSKTLNRQTSSHCPNSPPYIPKFHIFKRRKKKSTRSTIWARWFSDRALRKGCLKNHGPPGEPKIRRSNPIAALQKGHLESLDVDKLVNISVVIICVNKCLVYLSPIKLIYSQ